MKEIAKALAAVQAEIGAAAKSSTNPHFKSKYADLSEVWAAWQKVGPKAGLALTQTIKLLPEGQQALVTTLLHTSGESVTSEMLLMLPKNDMQGLGSSISYARRYCMAAMVGIVQDDDDANASVAGTPQTNGSGQRTAAPKPPEDPKIVEAREAYMRLKEAINGAKTPDDIETIIKLQGETLLQIKANSQAGYEQIMTFANDRKANCQKQAA